MDLRPLRLLVVEDSEDDTELLLRHLRRSFSVSHQRVQTAADLRQALKERWDVVLSDYRMPGFSGLEALTIVKESDADLPFLVVSGTIGEEAAVGALKAGAHDFLVKGNFARLVPAIERELREADYRRERRQAMRARDEFIADASHELRTPITVLVLQIASAMQIAKSMESSQLQAKLAEASRQLDRLTGLVNDLLDVTRVHATGPVLRRSRVDLRRVLETVLERRREAIERAKSPVTTQGAESVTGEWDAVALETVVGNLLSNALKFGEGKPIEIALTADDGTARFSITDRGIGIAPEDQARLFRRFDRPATSRDYGGFGIGLWMARQVVEAHGGTIEVSSAPGAGSTFTVTLPRRK